MDNVAATESDMCHLLREADGWQDYIFFPLGWSMLVVVYFSSIYCAVWGGLIRSYKRHIARNKEDSKLAIPYQPVLDHGYVAEKTVWKEVEQMRANEVLFEINTVSTYSCVTARGNQSLALFTSSISLALLSMQVFRAIFVPPQDYWDSFAFHLTMFGNFCLVFTGIMNTTPPDMGAVGTPIRAYNMIFSTFISTENKFRRFLIDLFHLGGVGSWAIGWMIATLIRALRAHEQTRDMALSSGALWAMFALEIALVISFATAYSTNANRKSAVCLNCSKSCLDCAGKEHSTGNVVYTEFFHHLPPRKAARQGIVRDVHDSVGGIDGLDLLHVYCDGKGCAGTNTSIDFERDGGFNCKMCDTDYCFKCGRKNLKKVLFGKDKSAEDITVEDCIPGTAFYWVFGFEVLLVITVALSALSQELFTIDACGQYGLLTKSGPFSCLVAYVVVAVTIIVSSCYCSYIGCEQSTPYDVDELLQLTTLNLFRYLQQYRATFQAPKKSPGTKTSPLLAESDADTGDDHGYKTFGKLTRREHRQRMGIMVQGITAVKNEKRKKNGDRAIQ